MSVAAVYLVIFLVAGFLLYVCMFGASSSGVIGTLHDQLTGCYCLAAPPIMLWATMHKILARVEHAVTTQSTAAALLPALMAGGFPLYALHSLPLIGGANQRLAYWHRYTSYATMVGGVLIFVAASFLTQASSPRTPLLSRSVRQCSRGATHVPHMQHPTTGQVGTRHLQPLRFSL